MNPFILTTQPETNYSQENKRIEAFIKDTKINISAFDFETCP